ncbi:hypothetical protein GF362_04975 [Candidatus Dojkabacteria bacterium]|nr:hypothetical protein [Candidatus Dojkabacteria bacterium]
MYIDSEMLKIICKNSGLDEVQTDIFVKNYRYYLFELIIAKIFNKYAEKTTDSQKKELEKTMLKIRKFGKMEDQQKVLDIIKKTMAKYPDLLEEIRNQQNELNSKLVFDYLKTADSESQVELLTYLLAQQKQTKIIKDKLDKKSPNQ